ncbi:DUF4091 domain-containing protein [Neobacillus niacini]|uniref:DUF4091 domain-containing protein n=1 Tax=Neobacillus niacini TaxID=86668 RepID=UPI0030008CE8
MRLGLQSMFYKFAWGYQEWQEVIKETDNKHIDLVCCRRDTVSLQAVVSSNEEFLLTKSKDTLFWKAGPIDIGRIEVEVDGAIDIEVKLVGLIPDDNGTLVSDMLLDQSYVYVDKRRPQQVWIECRIDENVKPGKYKGKVKLYTHTMFEDELLQEECSFSVTVKDVVMPEPKDYTFYLDLWQHPSNIARKYEVELWSEEHFFILDNYLHSLAQLGQKAVTLIVSEIPWSGQGSLGDKEPSDLFEYNMIRVTRKSDGSFHYDYSALDQYVEIAEKHGILAEIELFGLLNIWQIPETGYGAIVTDYPDAIRIRYFDVVTNTYRFIRKKSELEDYIHALEAHFIRRGWSEKVRVLADEPADFAVFQTRVQQLQQLAPSFKLKVAINHAEFIQKDIPGIHDAVPIISCAANDYYRLQDVRSQLPGKLLYYVCCWPKHPNSFISSPSLECRLIPWIAEKLGLDGFLRWSYTAWPDRPREKISYRPTIWPAGDTCLVYPGIGGKPLLSLRYKWLQRGIRDYEIMQMAKQSGRTEWVNSMLNRVLKFQDPSQICKFDTPEDVYSLRHEDYECLLQEW